jgi:hypothetical protein
MSRMTTPYAKNKKPHLHCSFLVQNAETTEGKKIRNPRTCYLFFSRFVPDQEKRKAYFLK